MYEPTAQPTYWPAPCTEQPTPGGKGRIWAFALLGTLAVGAGAYLWGIGQAYPTATAESFTTVPANMSTMSCEQLGAAHHKVAQSLSDYVDGVYRSSWDAKGAQRRLASEGIRDQALDVMRAFNHAMDTCSYMGAGR